MCWRRPHCIGSPQWRLPFRRWARSILRRTCEFVCDVDAIWDSSGRVGCAGPGSGMHVGGGGGDCSSGRAALDPDGCDGGCAARLRETSLVGRHATPERLGAFSDGVIAIIITITDVRAEGSAWLEPGGLSGVVADLLQLCFELPFWRDCMGESPSFASLCGTGGGASCGRKAQLD
jgi:hypothetical protein